MFPDITIENNSYLVIYCDTTQTSKDGVYYFTNYNLKNLARRSAFPPQRADLG